MLTKSILKKLILFLVFNFSWNSHSWNSQIFLNFQIGATQTMFDLEKSSFMVATLKEEVVIKSYGPDIVW